jgi:hypothetical protein
VEEIEPGQLLRLRAEMRVPGLAWLEFHVEQDGDRTRLRQKATFRPYGLFGHLYWWALVPFHGFVFGGMLRNVCRAAEEAVTPSAHRPTPQPGAVPDPR